MAQMPPPIKIFQLQLAASFREHSQAEPPRAPVLSAFAVPVLKKRCCAPTKRGAAADEPTVVPHPALIQLARLLRRQAARRLGSPDRRCRQPSDTRPRLLEPCGAINCKARMSQDRAIDCNGPELLQLIATRLTMRAPRGQDGRQVYLSALALAFAQPLASPIDLGPIP